MAAPTLLWDLGTAYDLFISLQVLHRPGDYGLRAAWAAGMRSRLPTGEREFLEKLLPTSFMHNPPMRWCYELPDPKDGATALDVLAETPASHRLRALLFDSEPSLSGSEPKHDMSYQKVLEEVADRGSWSEQDAEKLREAYQEHYGKMAQQKPLTSELDMWANSSDYGERVLSALQAYFEVFFAEEERRIQPVLEKQLEHAQDLAQKLDLIDLLEELSQGVRLKEMPEVAELVLAPTYWGAPFLYFGELGPNREIMLFGARPENASVVPGEIVPDQLLNALKALSDPTRLRILRYLTTEPLTPTQLARRLRLRAPTVIHHLHSLRSAGLVTISLGEGKERAYQVRREGVQSTCTTLTEFLESTDGDE